MKFETSDILYLGSAFLTVAAVLTFTSGESSLSPVTKIGVMSAIFVSLLVLGVYVERKPHQAIAFGLAAIVYLVGTGYALSKFGVGSDIGFLAFIILAAVFTALGQLLGNERITLDRRHLKLTFAVLLLFSLSITLFDVTGAEISYTLDLQGEVELNGTHSRQVGRLIMQNDFALPREIDQPSYRACIYPDTEIRGRVNVDTSYRTELVAGGGTREKTVELSLIPGYHEDQEEPEPLGTFKLERAERCPESSDEKKIVITRTEDDRY